MKHIVSQCKQQIFTCGECQVYNVAPVDLGDEEDKKAKLVYSVGVAGISFGTFKDEEQAQKVLKEISAFLGKKNILKEIAIFLGIKNICYTVPQCWSKK